MDNNVFTLTINDGAEIYNVENCTLESTNFDDNDYCVNKFVNNIGIGINILDDVKKDLMFVINSLQEEFQNTIDSVGFGDMTVQEGTDFLLKIAEEYDDLFSSFINGTQIANYLKSHKDDIIS